MLFTLKKHVVVGDNRHDVIVFHIVWDNYKVGALQLIVLSVGFIPKKLVPNTTDFSRIELLLILSTDWTWTRLEILIFIR